MSFGFPVNIEFNTATSSVVSGTVSNTTVNVEGPFAPNAGLPIMLTVVGTGASGTVTLMSSSDGGTTRYPITVGGKAWGIYQFSGVTGVIVNESPDTPLSTRITYYLKIQLTTGSVSFKIYQ
jgi:hypothetical protein